MSTAMTTMTTAHHIIASAVFASGGPKREKFSCAAGALKGEAEASSFAYRRLAGGPAVESFGSRA